MPKRTELSDFEKGMIVALKEAGRFHSQIAKAINRSKSTVKEDKIAKSDSEGACHFRRPRGDRCGFSAYTASGVLPDESLRGIFRL